ncbi:MAG: efflux RND transporter permease subunit [Desulfosporosinus sp.]|nr:efflux RND transporter permease subunit [Desulfosporosinus sp.]
MKIADISIRRPVTISMIMLVAILIGVIAMTGLPLELMPTMDLPIASVSTSFPGATPSEVEQQVTKPIEEVLQSLSGVQEIDSTSTAGSSRVRVNFNYGLDMGQQVETMRSLVNRVVNKLPTDATTPIVQQFDPSSQPIMLITLSGGKTVADISDVADNLISPALQHVDGVATVSVIGDLTRQITVEVDPAKLNYYNLSIVQITQALSAANYAADVGQAQRGTQLIPLKVDGQFSSTQDLLKVPLSLGKTSISVGDVATVKDGFQDVTLIAQVDDKPTVAFSIQQSSDANTVNVSNGVHKALDSLNKQLPQGMKITVITDSAQGILQAVHLVTEHTLLGFILGIILMLLILRSVRTTTVIAVAIPISVLTAFILMSAYHLTINTITLGSLGIALGSLVDFSVVVLESIFRARQMGLGPKEAASVGTKEVGTAVMVAAMAQICVFAPSLFTGGIAGQLFGPMALTVTFSHIVALVVALTLTPMLASKLLTGARFTQEETIPGLTAPFRLWAPFDWFGRGMHDVTTAYQRILGWSLKHRLTVVILAFALFVSIIPIYSQIGSELMPTSTSNQITVSLTLAPGTALDQTAKVVQEVENRIRQHMKNVSSVYEQIGTASGASQASTNTAQLTVTVNLTGKQSITLLANQLQPYISNIPGAKINAAAAVLGRGSSGAQVGVDISGPDLNTLALLSNQVAQIMTEMPSLRYVDNQLETGQPSYKLKLDQGSLVQNGLTEQQVVNALHTAFQGSTASTFYQGDNGYNVVVQYPETYAQDITKLTQVTIMNSNGQAIPLTQVATMILSNEPTVVEHIAGVRNVSVQANVFGTSTGQVQAALTQRFKALQVPAGYTLGFGQNGRNQTQAFSALGNGLLASIVLVYMVMAGMFESLLTPFVIMFSLPPTFVGAIIGLYLTHNTLNINSMMGMVMLVGLVTNNAIVLVDYTNQLRAKGQPLSEALMQAGSIRLRPIILTTVTNVAAMLPLLILGGSGTETLSSMAAVITFGLSLSTLVTLVLVPVMYVNMDNLLKKMPGKKNQAPIIPESF